MSLLLVKVLAGTLLLTFGLNNVDNPRLDTVAVLIAMFGIILLIDFSVQAHEGRHHKDKEPE